MVCPSSPWPIGPWSWTVNGADGAIAAGMMSGMVDHEFPVVLGRDYAGVVEQAGSDVRRYT